MSMLDCPRCWNYPCTCGYDDPNQRRIRELEARVVELEKKLAKITSLSVHIPSKITFYNEPKEM